MNVDWPYNTISNYLDDETRSLLREARTLAQRDPPDFKLLPGNRERVRDIAQILTKKFFDPTRAIEQFDREEPQ